MTRLISTIVFNIFVVVAVGCSTIHSDTPSAEALERYDLYVAPTFSRPSHFTIERHTDSYILREHAYRGKGGYSPKKLARLKTERISVEEWNTLKAIIDDGGFWTDSVSDINEWGYLDATLIRFEGKRSQQEKKIRQYGEYSAFLYELLECLDER
ncbi:MAG: hypothetical protein KDN22_02630 [Verrucomicrobiae bacterium]|nr:hypothetical protein [Verrucomicrobiae bacterium]